MNSVEQHAVSLAVDNEDVAGFNTGALLYALNRYHDKRDVLAGVERLLAKGILVTNGRTIFLADPEDWNTDE